MIFLKPKTLGKIGFVIAISATVLFLESTRSLAQDLDDTLESELDEMSSSRVETPDATFDEPPLDDPFAGEEEKAVAKPAKPAPKRTEPSIDSKADVSSLAPGSDEPNSAFEARLAKIYSESSAPVSDQKWSSLLGSRAAESYSVQAGDTLWDLSQTLFADGFYWSKLWAENPEIQNPHQISKGQAIRFIGGTEAAPPEIRVVKDEPDSLTVQTQAAFEREDVVPALQEAKPEEIGTFEVKQSSKFAGTTPNRALNQAPYYQEDIEGKITQADLEAGVVVEQGEIIPRPILPPPSEERRKLMPVPRSFREFKYKHFEQKVTVERRSNMAEKVPGAVVPAFIAFDVLPEPLGTVAEVDNYEVASLGQRVIIEANEPLTVGARVYTATPRYKLRSPSTGQTGEGVEVGGVLRIDERVGDGENLYRATVVYGVNPVRMNSMVIAGELPRVPVSTVGRRVLAPVTVIGGGLSDKRRFFGDGSTVFLDTAAVDVRVGDVMAVQARRGDRRKSIVTDVTDPIGILKVFAVHGPVASAVVVLTTEEIRPGDKTGAVFPSRLPDLRNEPPRVTKAAAVGPVE